MKDPAGTDVETDVKISRSTAPFSRIPHTGNPELIAGIHSRTDADLDRFGDPFFAAAVTGAAGFVDGLSFSAAAAAGLTDTEKALRNCFDA